MPHRLTKITTRTGDDGKTNLGTTERLSKSSYRIAAIGDLDELNSAIGLVIALGISLHEINTALFQVQQDLFDLGGELCPPYHSVIKQAHIVRLEHWVTEWNMQLPPLKEFILPGGTPTSAACHLARTICRRAERSIVKLHEEEKLNSDILRYLNRLSDVLFVAARMIAKEMQCNEKLWEHEKK